MSKNDANNKLITGYEGPSKFDSSPEEMAEKSEWLLERVEHFYSPSHIVAQVKKNGVSVGLVQLDREEDFEWLKKRIDYNANRT